MSLMEGRDLPGRTSDSVVDFPTLGQMRGICGQSLRQKANVQSCPMHLTRQYIVKLTLIMHVKTMHGTPI